MACGSLGQGTPRGAICRETAAGCTPTRRQPARSSRGEGRRERPAPLGSCPSSLCQTPRSGGELGAGG